jgi:hypothetical protein
MGILKLRNKPVANPLIFTGYKAGQFAPRSHSVSRTLNCCGLRHILRAKTYWREWSHDYFPSWSYSILLRLAVIAFIRIFLFRKAVACGQFSLVRCHRDVYHSLSLSPSLSTIWYHNGNRRRRSTCGCQQWHVDSKKVGLVNGQQIWSTSCHQTLSSDLCLSNLKQMELWLPLPSGN